MDQTTEKSLFAEGAIIGGRYQVLDTLGSGGMGTVVRVIDRALNNEMVALKLLYPHMAKDETSFARFRNEVLIARKLAHPNIVRLYDFGAAGQGYYYISMEYVEGGSLSSRIYLPSEERLNFQQCLEVLYAVCQGLACAHSHGVMHRDLKPDNILLTPDGTVKISDFGLARSTSVERGLTATGDTVGTPYYMAPEQLRGDKLDQRVDIYALGIMAFELTVGRRPFFHDSYVTLAHMHFRDPIPVVDNLPDWFQDFIACCAAKKRENRFLSAEHAAQVLADHIGDADNLEVESRPAVLSFNATRTTTKRPTVKRRVGRMVLLGIVLVVAMVGSVLVARSHAGMRSSAVQVLLSAERSFGVDASALKQIFNVTISESDFFSAVASGATTVVQDLLASGLDPNSKDSQGLTALHLAAKYNQAEVIEALLKHEATVTVADRSGRTPLSYAAQRASVEAVNLLLQAGADPSAVDAGNRTPLSYAATSGTTAVVQALLRAGALSGMRDSNGISPLMYAVEHARGDIVQVLIDARIDLNLQDNAGNTALHYAARADNEAIVSALIRAGISENLLNNQGKSAVEVAPTRSRKELRELIAKSKSRSSAVVASGAKTSLRLRAASRLQLRPVRGGLALTQVVENPGTTEAGNVRVELLLPNGERIALDGPQDLAANQEAHYQATADVSAIMARSARVLLRCDTCKRN